MKRDTPQRGYMDFGGQHGGGRRRIEDTQRVLRFRVELSPSGEPGVALELVDWLPPVGVAG